MAAIANSYFPIFKSAITRIFHANGAVVGAGFLVAGRSQSYIVTCAHVVTAALSLPRDTVEILSGNIYLDFPLIAPEQKLTAKVVFWRSVKSSASEPEDIAGLAIEGQLPSEVAPIKLISASELWEHPLRIFGFPSGHNDGVWATGVLRDRQAKGWVQIEDVKVTGYRVEPGFSGAPIWDEALAGVVGMAIAAEKQREDVKTAFMLPAGTLLDVWSELVSLNLSPPIENKRILKSTKQFRAEIIQDSIKSLQEDYQAAYNQLNYTLSEVDRSRLKRQIKSLEGEMEDKERELNDLLG
ncbi:MAG: trypsin-like peptidase domain-containing protein [Pseudanabaena sp. M135S2SP2A07QC]|nr:trypsin-like peptidase domain-containing protein [Pseudanabaena sp. M090S1SP2A07QC]MCA6504978.1 trypsin-like peptidase domain-containing protein [Pseudanabaena sp. M172S2SP2A07QC]MCA6518744.1 trypsin-like peptidase domain-containing protein [Pseudanabaena sp. M110S1SP2A07QC]MCA6520774.1 trypsin-like peptidase domain-containing protein [Pseudanabaena sp. M051S1SP2A07QC]MCA6526361.1 trypsin-like peptidase domain-containing protein [Pseudanabaena sp. M179S2SP2A07QC]MCA6532433.1 trypsin-like pe